VNAHKIVEQSAVTQQAGKVESRLWVEGELGSNYYYLGRW
jgi:hypothetical protein